MRTFIGVFVFALSYVHAFKRITTKPNIFSIRGGANDVKPSEDSFDILIIGAGLAGLALASGLSANGLKVGILERAKSFERRGGALGVAPNGMRALVELNKVIADKVHKQGFTLDLASMKFATVQDNYTKQEVWAEEFKDDVDLQNMKFSVLTPWWAVRDALVESLPKDVFIMNGCEIEEIIESDPSEVSIRLKSGGIYKSKVVVASDGINSVIRKHLNLSAAIDTQASMWRSSCVVSDELLQTLQADSQYTHEQTRATCLVLRYSETERLGAACFFHPENRITWVCTDGIPDSADTQSKETVADKFAGFPGPILKIIQQTDEVSVRKETIRVHDLPIAVPWPEVLGALKAGGEVEDRQPDYEDVDWKAFADKVVGGEVNLATGSGWGGRGRICLIGDAAHAMRPASGYGSSMAFEDVIVLCRRLLNTEHLSKVDNTNTAYCKTLIGDDEKVVSALQAYESERLKRVAVIHTQQKLLAESPKPVQSTCPKFQQWVHAGI